VSDAGPPIHLDELGCLDLLADFGKVLLPHEVWAEVGHHRPRLSIADLPGATVVDVVAKPSARLRSLGDSLGLDAGEKAALVLAEVASAKVFLCDDAAARLAAESLGLTVRGTIGIMVRSIRKARRTKEQVVALLREVPEKSSLHFSRKLLETVIAEVAQS
jgi:predicted nucleic acid-binding protein